MIPFENDLDELTDNGLRRSLVDLGSGGSFVNFSSNDYLGLSRHADVVEAACAAARDFGGGGTSSRLLAGTNNLHRELETELAAFLGKEAALVFSSGYHANTGILPALAKAGDLILFDRLCHASLVDGIRLSQARFATYKHNDLQELEEVLLEKRTQYKRVFLVTEGWFSMDGDSPDLVSLVRLAKNFDALTYVDEAHSFGLLGENGRGLADEKKVLTEIDIFVGTLSKSLGSQGGFVAGSQTLIDLLISRCRSFMFTTALAPACAGAALAALKQLPKCNDRRGLVRQTARVIRETLFAYRFRALGDLESPIVPVWTGTLEETQSLSRHLKSKGFFVPSIRPPTVAAEEGRVRLSITFDAVKDGVKPLLKSFEEYKFVQTI